MAESYLNVKVYPRAKQQSLEQIGPGEYKIKVSAPPEKDRANREVIEILAAHFGLPPSSIRIVKGPMSRNKLVAVEVKKER